MAEYNRILVATDGSDEGVAPSIDHALTIAQSFGAKIYILYVSDEKVGESPIYMGDNSPEGKGITSRVKKKIDRYGVEAETAVAYGDPADKIQEFAMKEAVDLIVMGTHGRKGISRVLKGSVTEKVVRESRKPVLAVERK